MIQYQLKLKLTGRQERELERWLRHLTSIWNWGLKKIENDARDGFYRSGYDLISLLAGHGKKLRIPSHTIQAMVTTCYEAWIRCFKGTASKPRLKGRRNRLNSIPFPDVFRVPKNGRIFIPILGRVRFHKQEIPEGKIKGGRVVKRASGWYLCLFIDSQPTAIPRTANGQIGIDPGFNHLLTLSTGEKVAHPREMEASALRLAQVQRGNNRGRAARVQERIANQRKDRNHKLSRRLVSENELIVFSADNHKAISKRFGKSVASSSHGQLRSMLAYKCRTDGREYIEVSPNNSTRTCSSCGALTGPQGWAGLSVRHWTCPCGAELDRDINAAINTLVAGRGSRHEMPARAA